MVIPVVKLEGGFGPVQEADRRQLAHERVVLTVPVGGQLNVLGGHAGQVPVRTV